MTCSPSGSGKSDSICYSSCPVWVRDCSCGTLNFFQIIFLNTEYFCTGQKHRCEQGRLLVSTGGNKAWWRHYSNTDNNFNCIFPLDNLPAVWRERWQPGEQEGDRADLDHHHPARVRRQVQQRRPLHRQGGGHRGPRQVGRCRVGPFIKTFLDIRQNVNELF